MMSDALPLPDSGSAAGDFTAQVRQVSTFYVYRFKIAVRRLTRRFGG
jgi:hypothetical protein